ncbi:uncharacterized protein LOC119369264 [Jatropha curcas]|uniref:uncharacterized protein LOC119369264 n=1 Tax=Jatropha curcas TaxID=180498 RepID=UPI001895E07D|nr:uncharacterized protein LOC119369264 [Jatropha curcas]
MEAGAGYCDRSAQWRGDNNVAKGCCSQSPNNMAEYEKACNMESSLFLATGAKEVEGGLEWNASEIVVGKKEENEIMKKIHDLESADGKVTACQLYSVICKALQYYHDNKNHLPAVELHPTTPSWPFSAWGIDIIGKIIPVASNAHQYILVAVDYFSRWIEAQSYKTLNAKQVARFIEQNIFCCYSVPHHIVTDNGSHFQANVSQLLYRYKVEHHHSSPYRPQANGAVEAANKDIKRILSKICEKYRSWAEKLPFALWGHRTTSK